MERGLDWYQRDPRAFIDGVQGLGPDLIGAYAVLLDLFYARGGRTVRDDRHLAGILGCSVRKARALTDGLLDRQKIEADGDFITNSRAKREAKSRRNTRETLSEAGRKGAEKRWRDNKNKDLDMATPDAPHIAEKRESREDRGGSAHAHAREDDPAPFGKSDQLIDRVVEAAEADVSKSGWYDFNVLAAIRRWRDLGLEDDEMVGIVANATKAKRDGPASSPAYFDRIMERCAGEKNRAPLEPQEPQSQQRRKSRGQERFDRLMQMAAGLDRRAEAERDVDHGKGAGAVVALLPGRSVGGGGGDGDG